MLDRCKLIILLQGLSLVLLGPASEASSLGMTVHVEPLDKDEGKTVRAHFSVITPSPCPPLTGLCSGGEDCLLHTTSLPFTGTKPGPGWCVRQWQKTVPSDYKATIILGSNTKFYVSMNAGPVIRGNNGKLNQPAYAGLLPPLRARVNCPHHFHLSVRDLDGDRVRCRFARPDQGECVDCAQHSFIELDEEKCMLTFTGKASAGQYFIYLMAEDLIPVPRMIRFTDNKPLSSVPVHLSLTVEESTTSCSDEPVATGATPEDDSVLLVLPFQEVKFNVEYASQRESVLEVAVVGPPELYRVGFKTIGPLAVMTMAWVRADNNLTRLLPVCFDVNTNSLQSEPRCVWLYQRQTSTLPAGTELKCEKTEMRLALPVSSLSDINLTELQLNSPTCPLSFNSTHLTARIPLDGCGTKRVHSGSELVYTNVLQSVRSYTVVSRELSLILPLACRIPGVQASGPQFQLSMPSEKETFGDIRFWIEIFFPGEGPMAEFTSKPKFRKLTRRARREVESPEESDTSIGQATGNNTSGRRPVGSKIDKLDLHVMSNCSIDRAEMMVSSCIESENEDFRDSHPILNQGCSVSDSTLEIITLKNNTKIYRLDFNGTEIQGSLMYIQCIVNLCITTLPSMKCPDLCTRDFNHEKIVGSVFTSSHTINSGPVSLVVTTPVPTTTATTAITTRAPNQNTNTSHAPEQTSTMAAGVILTIIRMFIQNFFLS